MGAQKDIKGNKLNQKFLGCIVGRMQLYCCKIVLFWKALIYYTLQHKIFNQYRILEYSSRLLIGCAVDLTKMHLFNIRKKIHILVRWEVFIAVTRNWKLINNVYRLTLFRSCFLFGILKMTYEKIKYMQFFLKCGAQCIVLNYLS